jgi:hypothetical protein
LIVFLQGDDPLENSFKRRQEYKCDPVTTLSHQREAAQYGLGLGLSHLSHGSPSGLRSESCWIKVVKGERVID